MKRQSLTTSTVLGLSIALGACNSPSPATADVSQTRSSAPVAPPAQSAKGSDLATANPTSLSSERVDAIVDAFLREQYPDGRDSQHDCWKTRYGEGDEAMAYCMRLLPTASVTEGGRHVIYIALASAADISGSEDYRYAAVDPGMFDAFRVGLAPDGRAKLTASSKGMDFGAAGDCGCADADFIPLGPDVHGWAFSSGVTQQGETSSTHSLIAPVGGSFRDVAGITQYAEGDADTEYRVAVGNNHPTAGWFPLTVSKYRNGQKLASRAVEFDPAAGRYGNLGTF